MPVEFFRFVDIHAVSGTLHEDVCGFRLQLFQTLSHLFDYIENIFCSFPTPPGTISMITFIFTF